MGLWGFNRLLPLIALSLAATPGHVAERAASCGVAVTGQAVPVTAALDERTLRLSDGTEVRLAGLASIADAGSPAWAQAAASRAKAALEELLRGKAVVMEHLGEDRYGRRIALAAIPDTGKSLQEVAIAQGLGLVSVRVGHSGCAAPFLAAERAARSAGLGVWADPQYLVRDADGPVALGEARGRFALVEGKVLSVNDRGATVYVNFGRRWSEDFTVTIAKRNVRNVTAAGLDPQALVGRRVRIRGWVDERGGPWIEASGPEQIEFTDRN